MSVEEIAAHRETWQSSNGSQPSTLISVSSSLAVDGNNDSDVFHGSCIATNETLESFAWWAVDLGEPFLPDDIELTNIDCPGMQIARFVIQCDMFCRNTVGGVLLLTMRQCKDNNNVSCGL